MKGTAPPNGPPRGWGDETPITLVDSDNDGQPEVFVAGVLSDGATGAEVENLGIAIQFLLPAVVDLDGDGAVEVLYADEVSFTIFDGRTGATLYRDTNRGSITMSE